MAQFRASMATTDGRYGRDMAPSLAIPTAIRAILSAISPAIRDTVSANACRLANNRCRYGCDGAVPGFSVIRSWIVRVLEAGVRTRDESSRRGSGMETGRLRGLGRTTGFWDRGLAKGRMPGRRRWTSGVWRVREGIGGELAFRGRGAGRVSADTDFELPGSVGQLWRSWTGRGSRSRSDVPPGEVRSGRIGSVGRSSRTSMSEAGRATDPDRDEAGRRLEDRDQPRASRTRERQCRTVGPYTNGKNSPDAAVGREVSLVLALRRGLDGDSRRGDPPRPRPREAWHVRSRNRDLVCRRFCTARQKLSSERRTSGRSERLPDRPIPFERDPGPVARLTRPPSPPELTILSASNVKYLRHYRHDA